jgi:hypothetical protein
MTPGIEVTTGPLGQGVSAAKVRIVLIHVVSIGETISILNKNKSGIEIWEK